MSLGAVFAGFEVDWDDVRTPIQDVVHRIQAGELPGTLEIFNRMYGTVDYGSSAWHPGVYSVSRTGPPLNGTRGGVGRTFGFIAVERDRDDLLWHINDVFGNIARLVAEDDAQRATRQAKLTKLQIEGSHKLMNRSNRYLPQNVRNQVTQLIGEKPPVKGSYAVPASQAMINTTLFTNGEVNVPRYLKKLNTTLFTSKGGKSRRHRPKRRSTRRASSS